MVVSVELRYRGKIGVNSLVLAYCLFGVNQILDLTAFFTAKKKD